MWVFACRLEDGVGSPGSELQTVVSLSGEGKPSLPREQQELLTNEPPLQSPEPGSKCVCLCNMTLP